MPCFFYCRLHRLPCKSKKLKGNQTNHPTLERIVLNVRAKVQAQALDAASELIYFTMDMLRKIILPMCSNMKQISLFSPTVSPVTVTRTFSVFAMKIQDGASVPRQLLIPTVLMLVPTCGFKVVGKLKKRCKDCYIVVRHERAYVICKTKPRHKQMAMKKDEDKTWILTYAAMGPKRPW